MGLNDVLEGIINEKFIEKINNIHNENMKKIPSLSNNDIEKKKLYHESRANGINPFISFSELLDCSDRKLLYKRPKQIYNQFSDEFNEIKNNSTIFIHLNIMNFRMDINPFQKFKGINNFSFENILNCISNKKKYLKRSIEKNIDRIFSYKLPVNSEEHAKKLERHHKRKLTYEIKDDVKYCNLIGKIRPTKNTKKDQIFDYKNLEMIEKDIQISNVITYFDHYQNCIDEYEKMSQYYDKSSLIDINYYKNRTCPNLYYFNFYIAISQSEITKLPLKI